jgi:hypothetical protein
MKTTLTTITLAIGLFANAQNALLDSSFLQGKKTTSRKPTTAVDDSEPSKKLDPNRLVFGGNIGASFGDFTFVNLSPQVGYAFKPWLTAGAGINYIYNSFKIRDFNGNEVYRENFSYAGLNVFARAFPIKFIMLSAQPEINYSWGKLKYKTGNIPDQKLDGAFVPVLLLGGGVVIPTGGRGGVLISLQYDVIQNERSPYGTQPFVNVGFTF